MFTWPHLFIGLIVLVLGIAMVKYSYQVANYTGRQAWIENRLGSGSTYFAYKMFGLLSIFIGVLYATGLSGAFGNWIFSPLSGFFSPARGL